MRAAPGEALSDEVRSAYRREGQAAEVVLLESLDDEAEPEEEESALALLEDDDSEELELDALSVR